MADIVIMVANDGSRAKLSEILRKTGASVEERPFVPDIVDFLSKEIPRTAVIDADYFEKSDGELKNRLPKTNLIAWTQTYNPQRSVNLIALGAMDVLCEPATRSDVAGVVGHFSGVFHYKRKSDFTFAARLARALKAPAIIGGAVASALFMAFALKSLFMQGSSHSAGVYTLSVANPTGIYVEGDDVWVSDWLSGSIYGFKLKSSGAAEQFQSYYFADCNPLFVKKSGHFFWTGSSDGIIRKYSVETEPPVLVEKFRSGGFSPSGFCVTPDFVYTSDSQTGMIYQYVSSAGYPVLNSYEYTPGASPVGLVFDGKYFYTAAAKTGRVYRHLGHQNRFVPVGSYGFLIETDAEVAGFFKSKKNIYILTATKPARLYVYPYRSPR
ncbi:MAG: hypothetical protein QME32_03730 [Endomicrobiia bacterium]|nr:hypothetical protein [Endomicrobiia bacterium]